MERLRDEEMWQRRLSSAHTLYLWFPILSP